MYTGTTALEHAVRRPRPGRLLLIATHGEYVLPSEDAAFDDPLVRSRLILAGGNHLPRSPLLYVDPEGGVREEREDGQAPLGNGMLTAYEITGLDLRGAEMVQLVACQTGLGDLDPQGVAGLRQAFVLAGAESLMASLWEVPANETVAQFDTFYDHWLGSDDTEPAVNRYEAFRRSQQTALSDARERLGTGHPFFWAGFVYVGDPGE